MRNPDKLFRIVCLILAGIGAYQLARIAAAGDPLKDATIPPVPIYSEPVSATPTNSPAPSQPASRPVPGPTPAGFAGPQRSGPMGPPGFLVGPGRPTPGNRAANVPPEIQAQIDRIQQSEILGPVPRPLPMALLGIAGDDAFIRTPTGQTSLMRQGDEVGGVKLLLISTNRVLIEYEGQKKELMIFSGFGSETLMHK